MKRTIFILIVWNIIFFMHLTVYLPVSRVFEFDIPYWYLMLGFLSFSYLLASIGVRKFESKITDWFYYLASVWLGTIFLLFSASFIYVVGHLIFRQDSPLVLGGFLLTALLLAAYSVFQGSRLITREYTLPISGLTKSLRMVHLTDIHVGTIHKKSYLEKVVRETNALSPELVLITGDLFDGSAPINESILLPLNEIKAPSFFSNGNHEEYEGLKHVHDTVLNLNLKHLENQMTYFEELQIIGVNDRQSLPKDQTLGSVLETISYQPAKPTILMYHSPTEWEDAQIHGVDLMLSGHTHNGQIYPFNLLVKTSYKYINGLFNEGGKYLHVSPGTGTWGPPMRLGSRNQITVITLVSAED